MLKSCKGWTINKNVIHCDIKTNYFGAKDTGMELNYVLCYYIGPQQIIRIFIEDEYSQILNET